MKNITQKGLEHIRQQTHDAYAKLQQHVKVSPIVILSLLAEFDQMRGLLERKPTKPPASRRP